MAKKSTSNAKKSPKSSVEVKEVKSVEKKSTKKVEKPIEEVKVVENKIEQKKLSQIIKDNSYLIILCIICILLIINIVLIVVGHKAKLKNGEEIIATVTDKEITTDELYSSLKDSNGLNSLINMIDEFIVNKEITDEKEAKEYAEEQVKAIREQYESYNYDWNETLTSYGYKNEDALLNEIIQSYKKELVVKNYLKDNLKDDEIQKYYDEEVFNSYTAKHILITPSTTDEMTDEEKSAAEEAAKNKAQEVINRLNNGEDWNTLVSEYSQDEGSKDNEGLVENFTKGDVVDEFFNAMEGLEDGKYTTEPVKSSYGYHVILRVSETKKESLDDMKDEIIDELIETKLSEDDTLYDNVWAEIRSTYKLKINDTDLEKSYNSTIKG